MSIDPRYSFYLSLTLAVCGFLAGAGSEFTDLGLGEHAVKGVLAIDALIIGIGNAVNAVLAAIPSKDNKTGFYLAPKDPPK